MTKVTATITLDAEVKERVSKILKERKAKNFSKLVNEKLIEFLKEEENN